MVPKKCLIDAGRHFLQTQNWSEGVAEEELIDLAIRTMGLNELKPFDPKEKIIELKIEAAAAPQKSLLKMDLRRFCNETLSDSPAPGGGSVAALIGALGVSLGGMVANLSAAKRGWEEKLRYFSDWAVEAQRLKDEMLSLVDEDTAAFNNVIAAFGLPKATTKEKSTRTAAIEAANKLAAEVPLRVMQTAAKAYDLLAEMAARGNPASISDVGVGLLALRACIEGAGMNVRINIGNLKDDKNKTSLSNKVQVFTEESETRFKEISKIVEKKLKG
jgi:glutamate formiminotransferase/formiminotetrahydrofolate cyclodeaminase